MELTIESAPLCPDCGSKMFLCAQRSDSAWKYNPFWGCSHYPECDGSREINIDDYFKDEKPASIELTRGEIVTALRMRKKWTKSTLAQEAGLSRNYIRMIENGEANNLGERALFAIADALGVNASQLLKRPK